mgnify:CR=1 FL=1
MLKELFSYMKQYKKYARISLACIAVECIFELVIPLIMGGHGGCRNRETGIRIIFCIRDW